MIAHLNPIYPVKMFVTRTRFKFFKENDIFVIYMPVGIKRFKLQGQESKNQTTTSELAEVIKTMQGQGMYFGPLLCSSKIYPC